MNAVLLLDTNVWSHLILGEASKRQKVQADLDALLQKYPGAARAVAFVWLNAWSRRGAWPTLRSVLQQRPPLLLSLTARN